MEKHLSRPIFRLPEFEYLDIDLLAVKLYVGGYCFLEQPNMITLITRPNS